jgi:hypothetical protein
VPVLEVDVVAFNRTCCSPEVASGASVINGAEIAAGADTNAQPVPDSGILIPDRRQGICRPTF